MGSDHKHNSLDDPPCPDGDDLGLGGAQPALMKGSAGVAYPEEITMFAVRVPIEGVTARPRNHNGTPIARIALTVGDYHVMASPLGGGMQFCLPADLLDPEDPKSTGAFITLDVEAVDDPRAILLRHFWQEQGCDVTPIPIRRTGLVNVRGQFAIVRVGNRWFDGDNVHAQLGRTWIVEQGERLRFLRPWEMSVEFSHVLHADRSQTGF